MLSNPDSGPRKRKKPARYEDADFEVEDEFGNENEPPKSLPKVKQESLLAKAQRGAAGLGSSGKKARKSTGRNSTPLEKRTSLDGTRGSAHTQTPLGESNLNKQNIQSQKKPQEDSTPKIVQPPTIPADFVSKSEVEYVHWDRPENVGVPGQLKALTLVNFMCHEHLQMTFGPHVNFISGQNGSGKSAVLQAIQQVLGVRARDTGRATAQTSFIKSGCHEAVITITLWNEGPDAFQPELFGNEIIVERRIGRSSSFSVKSAKGRKLGSKRDDLDMILEALGINAANPIAVMTQDTTRSFMDGGTGKRDRQKYDIYMEATSLARIEDANAGSSVQLATMHAEIGSEKDKHDLLMKEQKELEARVDALDELDNYKKEEQELQQGLCWASVLSTRFDVENYTNQIEVRGPELRTQAELDIERLKAELAEAEANNTDQATLTEEFDLEMEGLSLKSQAARDRQARAGTEQRKAGNALMAARRELKKRNEAHQALVQSSVEAHADLAAESQASLAINKSEKECVQSELDTVQQKQDDFSRRQDAHNKRHHELFNRRDALSKSEDHHKKSVAEAKANVKKEQKYQTSHLERFGPLVQQQVNLIVKNRARFHKSPIGPIGALLTLKHDKYRTVMDNCVGRLAGYFICHDHHDLMILKKICQTSQKGQFLMPNCIIAKHDAVLYRIDKQYRDSTVSTLYDIIGCNDKQHEAVVLNVLTDLARIECQGLANSTASRSMPEMRRLLTIRGIDTAWSTDGCRLVQRRNSVTLIPPDGRKYFGIKDGSEDGLQEARQELTVAQMQLDECQTELNEVVRECEYHRLVAFKELDKARKENLQLKEDLEKRVRKLDEQREETETQLAEILAVAGSSTLAEEIEQTKAKASEMEEKVTELEEIANAAVLNLEEAEQAHQAVVKEVEELTSKNQADLDSFETRQLALQNAREQLVAMDSYCEVLEAKLLALEEAKQIAEANLAINEEQAAQICPEAEGVTILERIKEDLRNKQVAEDSLAPRELPLFLNKKLDRLQTRIKKQENEAGGRRSEVEDKLRRMKRRTHASQRSLDAIFATYNLLKAGFDWRKCQFERMDRMVEETVNIRFNTYLNKKGHNGQIKVIRKEDSDHNALEIKVLINGDNTQGRVKDLKQLSGGERSFTTVAFALALGEFTHTPFRAMDEFDVFMDAVNRQISLESLLTNATEQRHLQFLFLTPLDISAVEGAKAKMRERGKAIKDSFIKIQCMRAARG